MANKRKLVIDTDCGADDFLAIMFACSQLDWEVLAITCIFGNTDVERASSNALRLIQHLHKTHVPVFQGCSRSIIGQMQEGDYFYGLDGMGGKSEEFPLPNDVEIQEQHAVNFLVDIAKKHPNEITLVALGPLTNLALAERIDPKFSSNLLKLCIMGGSSRAQGNMSPVSEFNFFLDVEAASIVIYEFQCEKFVVPYETCTQSYISWDIYSECSTSNSSNAHFVFSVNEQSVDRMRNKTKRPGFVSCDFVAMAAVLVPGLAKTIEKRHVTVETHGKQTRGQMVVDYRIHSQSVPNVFICMEVDVEQLTQHWKSIVL